MIWQASARQSDESKSPAVVLQVSVCFLDFGLLHGGPEASGILNIGIREESQRRRPMRIVDSYAIQSEIYQRFYGYK